MTEPRLADVAGCPFTSLDDLRRAHVEGRVFLSVDRSFSIDWIDLRGSHPSRAETVFHFSMSLSMYWVGFLMAALAWRSVGASALLLILISLVAGLYCRPWRGHLTWIVALAALVVGRGFVSWAGGTWLLTAFLISGWISWCAARLTERLLNDETLLAWALQPRGPDLLMQGPVAVIKPGRKHKQG